MEDYILIYLRKNKGIVQKAMKVNQREILHKGGIDNCNFYTIEQESIPFWRCSSPPERDGSLLD